MNHTIQLTAEQFEALQSGHPITIEPPKPAITKWEPIGGAYTINSSLNLVAKCESTEPFRLSGVEYQTKSQADNAAKAIRAYARKLAWLAENDDGWIADWNDYEQNKYFVSYSHYNQKFGIGNSYNTQFINTIFMSKANAEKLAQLMNDGIVEF